MSDFQKQTLKNYGRVFLILCGVVSVSYTHLTLPTSASV